MKKITGFLFIFLLSTTASGHDWHEVRTCEAFHGCKDGISQLTVEEVKVLNRLLNLVKPGANEQSITVALGEKAYKRVPETPSLIGPAGTVIGAASWSTSIKLPLPFGPGVDVLFTNRKASSFRWWIASPGFGRYVQVVGSDDLVQGKIK